MKFASSFLVVLLSLMLGACSNFSTFLSSMGGAAIGSSSKESTANKNSARVSVLKDNATCCIGGGADCDCDLEKDKQIVYVDKPIEECTRSVRTVKQVDTCPTCSPFPVAVRERGSCASN
ncbi:MAG TPA: hypothetical protein VGK09_05180 [Rhodocyclaceae bacterium]|jgi:hypothetical protein